MTKRVLLEGRPGIGKSTVARRLVQLLQEGGVSVRGFVTDERRESGRRVGFVVETTNGERATLAHVDFHGPPRVGRYGVDIESFERVVLPLLDAAGEEEVVVIDELGKMELASSAFREAVNRVFAGAAPIVATVHAFEHPVTDALKQRADVELVGVRPANRDELPQRLARQFGGGRRGRSGNRR